MDGVLEYDAVLGKVNVVRSKTLDVSNGMIHMSPSQKASIVEGVGRDIDIGMYSMKANDLVSRSLISSKTGILYSTEDGTIASMDGVLEYDAVLGKVNVVRSKTLDVSNGMIHMSPSQKASIVEGVGQDVNFGNFDIRGQSLTV